MSRRTRCIGARERSTHGRATTNSAPTVRRVVVQAEAERSIWEARLLCAMIAISILTPAVTIRSAWPDVRLEQLLALGCAGWLLRWWWRAGRPVRPTLLDWLFVMVGVSTLLSVVVAPRLLDGAFSPRDLYEVAKVGLYWVLLRSAALMISRRPDTAGDGVLHTFLLCGGVSGLLGWVQYGNLLSVNDWLTPLYAPAHHLRTLAEEGRAVGTVGNANYFGTLSALTLLGAMAYRCVRGRDGVRWPLVIAVVGGAGGLVTSASRGATLAWIAGTVVLWAAALLRGWSARSESPARPPDDHRGHAPASASGTRVAAPQSADEPGGVVGQSRPDGVSVRGASSNATASEWPDTAMPWMGAGAAAVRRLAVASGAVLLLIASSVIVVQAVPRGRSDYLTRMTGGEDGSLALRLERWRSLVQPWRDGAGCGGAGAGCDSGCMVRAARCEDAQPTSVAASGAPTAGGEAAARDAARVADVDALAAALSRYRAERGVYPHDLATVVIAGYLPAFPADPSGGAYRYEQTAHGFSIVATLEDPARADYPQYARGAPGNLLRNGSFEDGADGPTGFRRIPGTRVALTDSGALVGRRAVRYLGNPNDPARRAALFQQRYLERPGGEPLTAALWVRLATPAEGRLWLWTNVYYADGTRDDPHALAEVDLSRTGVWQRVVVPVLPDPAKRVTFVGVYLLSEGFVGEALVDGVQLVEGRAPLALASLRAAPAASDDRASRLRESPLLGVGPGKAEGAGTVDNEYLTMLTRYGVLGLLAYLALWGGVALTAWRTFQRADAPAARALALLTLSGVPALLTFALVAGPFLHLQLMAVWWLLVGAATHEGTVQGSRVQGSTGDSRRGFDHGTAQQSRG